MIFFVLITGSLLFAGDFPITAKLNAKEHVSLSPKSVYTFTVFVQSLSKEEVEVSEAIELPESWECIFQPENFHLKYDESTVRFVSFYIPANSLPGLYTIKYMLKVGQAVITKEVNIEILPNLELKILDSSVPKYLISHSEFSFFFTVFNAGNAELNIKLTSHSGVFISLEPSQIKLLPFESKKIKITGKAPEDDSLFLNIDLLGTSPTGKTITNHFRTQIEIISEGIQSPRVPPDSVFKVSYGQNFGWNIRINSKNFIKVSPNERYYFNLNMAESQLDGLFTFEKRGIRLTIGDQYIETFSNTQGLFGVSFLQTNENSFLDSGIFLEPVTNTLFLNLRSGTVLENFYSINGNALFSSNTTCFELEHSMKYDHLFFSQKWKSSFTGHLIDRKLFSFLGTLSYPNLNLTAELSLQNRKGVKSYNASTLFNYMPELNTTFSFKYTLNSEPPEEIIQTWIARFKHATSKKNYDIGLSFETQFEDGFIRESSILLDTSSSYYFGGSSLSVSVSFAKSSCSDFDTESDIKALLQLKSPVGEFGIGGILHEEEISNLGHSQKRSLQFSYDSSLNGLVDFSFDLGFNFENGDVSTTADFSMKYSSPQGSVLEFSLQNISSYQSNADYHFTFSIPFSNPFRYPGNTGEISGQVCTHDGTPLTGVVVSLNGKKKVLTNSEGYFSFQSLSDGKYYVSILKESLPKPLIPICYSSQTIELKNGEKKNIDFVAVPAAQLKGTVVLYKYQKTLFSDNKLVPTKLDKKLTIMLTNTSGEIRYTTTDEKGNFVFYELEPGCWTITLDKIEIPNGFVVKTNYISLDIQPGEVTIQKIEIVPKAKPIIYVGETKSL